ncbi:FCD domain-containing protein [Streptomyces sp. DASNCL29]|uniref:FCD domain-containing protein n=1 Tax=Streptomyces sp. DASNCL29 TaxID=2583819 RepID=UPI00110FAF10|nr:FCD domain-containing protein [Streptomyces sp. DASNCL29]TMU93445.1 FCD domain-containing protein [Streptomyces sp. DASNCL29]
MNSDEARQLFEVRLSLDPTAAELAATRRTDEDIAAMEAAVDKLLPVTRQWGEEALTAHRTFHQALYHRLVALIADGRAPDAAQLMRDHITHSLTATAISALEDRESHRHD